MATITSTSWELYKGTSISGTRVAYDSFNNTSQQQSTATIDLGAAPGVTGELYPGTLYGFRVSCVAESDSGWVPTNNQLYQIKTKISIEWALSTSDHGCSISENLSTHEFELRLPSFQNNNQGVNTADEDGVNYNGTDMSVDALYVYVSRTTTFGDAVRIVFTGQEDIQDFFAGARITNSDLQYAGANWTFEENRNYYIWVGVTDNANDGIRLYTNQSYATVHTALAVPTVSISSLSSTYNSVIISGITARSTSEQITSGYVEISTSNSFAAGQTYRVNLPSSTFPQNMTITTGDLDYQGNTITIQSQQRYYARVSVATATYANTYSATEYTDTPAAVAGVVFISGTSNLTPSSVTVNIGYDNQ